MNELTSEERRVVLAALREYYEQPQGSRVDRGIAYRLWSRIAHPEAITVEAGEALEPGALVTIDDDRRARHALRHISTYIDPFSP